HRKSRGNDPADGARKPWPSEFVGIELNGAINRSKFPFPKPVTFTALILDKPMYGFLEYVGWQAHETERDGSERCGPAAFPIVAVERRPAPVRILSSQK